MRYLFRQINSVVVAHGGSALSIPNTNNNIVENLSLFLKAISNYSVRLFFSLLLKILFTYSRLKGMIIVFDGINQLPLSFQDMHWLPSSIPHNVRIIITTKHSEPLLSHGVFSFCNLAKVLNFVTEFKPKTIEIKPMQDADKRKLIVAKLNIFGKTMTAGHIVLYCSTS